MAEDHTEDHTEDLISFSDDEKEELTPHALTACGQSVTLTDPLWRNLKQGISNAIKYMQDFKVDVQCPICFESVGLWSDKNLVEMKANTKTMQCHDAVMGPCGHILGCSCFQALLRSMPKHQKFLICPVCRDPFSFQCGHDALAVNLPYSPIMRAMVPLTKGEGKPFPTCCSRCALYKATRRLLECIETDARLNAAFPKELGFVRGISCDRVDGQSIHLASTFDLELLGYSRVAVIPPNEEYERLMKEIQDNLHRELDGTWHRFKYAGLSFEPGLYRMLPPSITLDDNSQEVNASA